jgi:hypothetical protein
MTISLGPSNRLPTVPATPSLSSAPAGQRTDWVAAALRGRLRETAPVTDSAVKGSGHPSLDDEARRV